MGPFAYILPPETAHIHCTATGLALFRRPSLAHGRSRSNYCNMPMQPTHPADFNEIAIYRSSRHANAFSASVISTMPGNDLLAYRPHTLPKEQLVQISILYRFILTPVPTHWRAHKKPAQAGGTKVDRQHHLQILLAAAKNPYIGQKEGHTESDGQSGI